ncbi:ATP-binding cassette domain-containing protein [Xanthocytophaga flava]|uniref:ATP-binding cassette domain-containing protein n=1 Tax=Xanthocytophaga flava TaxID=3048013 RepID=UPI0028D07B90|nr:ATP-binding cassette domain-containing protein [Xanthocytophaga flavus]MDJ1470005.1 ATP-binding cassette domain-containing protein [Xanthocytophaga flavus]
MREQVLKAILQLLAISARIDGISEEERETIRKFLYENVDDESVPTYIRAFENYLKTSSSADEEIYRICSQINSELELKQKIIIVLRLIEIGLADNTFSSSEDHFMRLVCEALHVEKSIYTTIREFVETRDIYSVQSENVLLIDSQDPPKDLISAYLQKPGIKSTLGVLRLTEGDMYLLGAAHPATEVFLNGQQLKSHYVTPLTSGSVIRASSETIYYSDIIGHFLRSERIQRIVFEVKEMEFFFPNGKQGLHPVNIAEESGTLVAIMGASGSGKSTLLNVLNGNLHPQRGRVLINGLDIHRQANCVQGVIGYVPQQNFLIEELTVYQNLYFTTQLCFAHLSEFDVNRLVVQTLRSLGLYEVKDLRVGSSLDKTISGGQRKRLNIGLELVRQPSVMFVDEPTSGLSSRDSENIMDLLRELTMLGKLIFVVIHQPSPEIFKMFDKLIVMDTGGYQVYYGNPTEGVLYFKNLVHQVDRLEINSEQIFNILEAKVVDEYGNPTTDRKISPQRWYYYFKEKVKLPVLTPTREQPPHTLNIPNRLRQWSIYTIRDILAKLSNRQYITINLIQAPLLALILSYIVRYHPVDELTNKGTYIFAENVNIPAFIFMSIIISLFMGLTISAEEIIKDAKTRKREAFLHLSRNSYLSSKVFVLFGFSVIQTVSYILVANRVVGIDGMDLTYFFVLFSGACFANMLGLNVSATFNSVITIYILIPILLIPQLVLGGIVIKFDEINPAIYKQGEVPVMGDFMASRWGFEALVVEQFMHNRYEKRFYPYDKDIAVADYKKTYYLPTLSSKLEYCMSLEDAEDRLYNEQYIDYLEVLRHEVKHEMTENPTMRFAGVDSITPTRFTHKLAIRLKHFLDRSRLFYLQKYNKAYDQRDSLMRRITQGEEARQQLIEQRARYYNEIIGKLATNSTTENRIIEYKGSLIQKIYPIYHTPVVTGSFWDWRTHFYAPSKPFLGIQIPTLWFNMIMMWMMTGLLYLTLYYNVFRRIVEGTVFGELFGMWRRKRDEEPAR